MNLFKKILGVLFGKKTPHVDAANVPFNKFEAWQVKTMKRLELHLKDWIIEAINEKKDIQFSWESGNDEAFLTLGNIEEESKNSNDLEEYLLVALDIPSAGEFQMNGTGTVYIQGDFVNVKYKSAIKAIIDYNEDTDEEIFSEEEIESGNLTLFSV